ncbi:glycosyltransferase family 2 protein [Humibacillus xanthopallidus]|uniref:glycosyltransferase family 2 protein n=1 Tax=Humibacillus xanthopallidus TaxID=412689 RepID=UPI00384B3427
MTGYAYAGYPALVALAARRRPVESYPDHLPDVTIVVSALDEQDVIGARLNNLRALDYPADRLEVVVVTDGSSDDTARVAQAHAWPGVVVLHEPERRGKAAAMARAVDHAHHSVIVFSDANNRYPPNGMRELLKPLADPHVGAVTGAKAVEGGSAALTGGERVYWAYESFIKRQESRLGCCTAVVGEMLAVRRALVPNFPSDLVNDDFFIAMQVARQGYRVAYAPKAVSWEPTSASLESDVVRRRRMTAGRWQSLFRWRAVLPVREPLVMWQVASHKYVRLLLPFSMAAAFGASLVAVAVSGQRRPVLAAVLVAQGAFYGLAALGDHVPEAAGPVRTVAVGARYLTRTNYASAEGLLAYLRGRRSLHLWERVQRTASPAG